MNGRVGFNPAVASALAGVDYHADLVVQETSAWRGWLPSIAAVVLGIAVIAAVGFAPGNAQQAAHDVRHTTVFPCH
jgi:cobalt transporter subunit CbtB